MLRQADIQLRLGDYLDELPGVFSASAEGPVVALGNPPYTRTQALTATYKRKAAKQAGGMISSGHANLAMLFQAATLGHPRDGDLSCMVLPASPLYTRAARELRAAIWKSDRPVVVHRWPATARAFIGREVQAAVMVLGPACADPGPIRIARVETNTGDVERIESWALERQMGRLPDSWYSAAARPSAAEGSVTLGRKLRAGTSPDQDAGTKLLPHTAGEIVDGLHDAPFAGRSPIMVRRSVLVAVLASFALWAPAAIADAAPSTLSVRLAPHFTLVDGGESIIGRARVACPPDTTVLEALAFGSQGTDPGGLYAEGFLAGGPCDGRRRWWTVQLFAFDTVFRAGKARVTAFVLVEDENGDTRDAGDSRIVRVTR